MLEPVEYLQRMTMEEFIGLCHQVPEKFDVIETERDENMDLTVWVQLESQECKAIKVITKFQILKKAAAN